MALIIDGNAVYEIDEECKKKKELRKKGSTKCNSGCLKERSPKKVYQKD